MTEIRVVPVENPGDLAAAHAIREVVFIEEQAVPESVERDDRDPGAYHVLAMVGGHAIGTGRLLFDEEPPSKESGKWGRVGRMAVLAKHRGEGVGHAILLALEQRAAELQLGGIALHAQVTNQDFYEKQGYRAKGDTFTEAGMPHVYMWKRL